MLVVVCFVVIDDDDDDDDDDVFDFIVVVFLVDVEMLVKFNVAIVVVVILKVVTELLLILLLLVVVVVLSVEIEDIWFDFVVVLDVDDLVVVITTVYASEILFGEVVFVGLFMLHVEKTQVGRGGTFTIVQEIRPSEKILKGGEVKFFKKHKLTESIFQKVKPVQILYIREQLLAQS